MLPRHAQLPLRPLQQLAKRFPDVLVQKAFDVSFGPAIAGDRLRVFGANDQEALAPQVHARVPGDRQARPHGGDEVTGRAARGITDGQRRLGGKHRDRADVRCEAVLDVEGLPRAFLLVLADTERVLARMPQGRLVDLPGLGPPRLSMISLTARPIVPFARQPGPKTLGPALISSLWRTGPLMMHSGEWGPVVAWTPCKLNCGSVIACTAAITTGR